MSVGKPGYGWVASSIGFDAPFGETAHPNPKRYETYRAALARQRRLYDTTIEGFEQG